MSKRLFLHVVLSFLFTISLVASVAGNGLQSKTALVEAQPSSSWGKSHKVAVVDDYYGDAVGYMYPADYPDQTFSPLAASQVSAANLANYDTVILFMFNPSSLSAAQKSALTIWVSGGGKLIIWDSDQVSPGSPWDYSWLPSSFTTSVPGQQGALGKGISIIEDNQLSSSDPSSPYYIDTTALNSQTDAVGDANVLTTRTSGWHIDMTATNVLGDTGPVHVYAGYGSGLMIYSALDWDYAGYNYSAGQWLKKMLRQELDCHSLPFAAPEVQPEMGLEVSVESYGTYYVGDSILFEGTVKNITDSTGVNVTARNVQLTATPPDAIEMTSTTYPLGDLAPGQSLPYTFSATAKEEGSGLELQVIASGQDPVLHGTISGNAKCQFAILASGAPKPDWSFAVITDLHIGYDYPDYDGSGWNDSGQGPEYNFTKCLESAVIRMLVEKQHYNIDFVVVLGDVSDTAERSEFAKARDILNQLNDPNGDGDTGDGIPYIPLIGNHDSNPYTQVQENFSPENRTDKATDGGAAGYILFQEEMWDKNPVNAALVQSRLGQFAKPNSVYQNYSFTYGRSSGDQVNFVCLDLEDKTEPLVGSVGDPFPGNPGPTSKFYEDYLSNHNDQQLVMLSHYPLYAEAGFTRGADVLQQLARNNVTAIDFAGHTHRNKDDTVVSDDYSGTSYRVVETEAVVPIAMGWVEQALSIAPTLTGQCIRIVQVSNGGILNYSTIINPFAPTSILHRWPYPFFTYSHGSYPEPGEQITFEAQYANFYGLKTSFNWDFGDGMGASGSPVVHTYAQDGDYDVTLTITTQNLITGAVTYETASDSVHVHTKHRIAALPPNVEACSSLTLEDLAQVPKNTYQPVMLTRTGSEETSVAEIGVHFETATQDIDLSDLVVDVDPVQAKSVLYMPSSLAEVDQHNSLFIPSTGAGAVYICKGATSLEDVSPGNADVIIHVGETVDGMTVEATFRNGREYYLVSGVTGTGGGELSNQAPVVTNSPATQAVQYSDPIVNVTITASDVDSAGQDLTAAAVGLPSGVTLVPGTTNGSGIPGQATWIVSGKALAAPDTYHVVVTVTDDQGASSSTGFDIVVTKEDARATYTGALFCSTSSATSSKATVTLAATIQDITAVDPGSDPDYGDIRNATVTFINRDTNTVIGSAPLGLAMISDTKTGTATLNWLVDIGSANSKSYTIGIIVNGFYSRNSSADDAVVTVSKPINDFVTGGGYLLLSSSSGLKAGDAGTKTNFGFNLKYNSSGKNLQGNINIIVRRTEADGTLHVYQIKGSAMTSLSVDPATGKATLNCKANIQDITNPLAPVSVDGNATLQVTMTDKGEPGTNDIIGVTVWNKSGGLWFSSNWSGTKTVGQTVGGGNLVVRGGAVVAATAGLSGNIPYLGYILAGLLGCLVIAVGMVAFFMWGRPLPTRD